MADCKVIVDGKEFEMRDLQRKVSSVKAFNSLATTDNDSWKNLVKEIASERFVNLDLFTPYKENLVTESIFSYVINLMGTLSPKNDIALKPNEAFNKVRASMINSATKMDFLLTKFPTDEIYKKVMEDPRSQEMFPHYSRITRSALQDLSALYKSVTDDLHWPRFRTEVENKFRMMGIDVKGRPVDKDISEAQMAELIEDQDDIFDNENRDVQQNWDDASAFMMNIRNTAGSRVKLAFSTIPEKELNEFGLSQNVHMNTVFEDVLKIGADLDVVNVDNFIQALQEKGKRNEKTYLATLANRLSLEYNNGNAQLVNEIMSVINKAYIEQILIKWSRAKSNPNRFQNKIMNSNRSKLQKQVVRDWNEAQKRSEIVTKDENGELVIDKEKVKELYVKMKQLANQRDNTIKKEDGIAWMSEFFKTVGIDGMTDEILGAIATDADKNVFKKQNTSSFRMMLSDGGVFGLILNQYLAKRTEGSENAYDDISNAMTERQSIFEKFAEYFIEYHSTKYQTPASRNVEGKNIYPYINRTFLEDVMRKIRNGSNYLEEISKTAFSKSSELVQNLLQGVEDVFNIKYMDGIKEDNAFDDGTVRAGLSDTGHWLDAIWKHQRGGVENGYYNLFTLSDKTTTPTVERSKYIFKNSIDFKIKADVENIHDSFEFLEKFQNELFKLAQGEIDRMVAYASYMKNVDPQGINDKNLHAGWKLFYIFPWLNNVDSSRMKSILNELHKGVEPTKSDIIYLRTLISEGFKLHVRDVYNEFIENGLIVTGMEKGKRVVKDVRFDDDYMTSKNVDNKSLNLDQKAWMAIMDLEFNYLRTQVNAIQILGADPALFFKGKVEVGTDETFIDENGSLREKKKTLTIDEMNFEQRKSVVNTTWAEFSKRAAMFIAPGSQGVWTWKIDGVEINQNSYRAMTVADVKRDSDLFKGIETTDAQEFITLKEHINRMMSEGLIDVDIWKSITQKIDAAKAKKTFDYKLTGEELYKVFQPTKPVHATVKNLNGFSHIDYVKSSTFPLIPGVYKGGDMDKIRIMMEREDIQSINFASAKKTGQPQKSVSLFDKYGNFVDPFAAANSSAVVEVPAVQTLNREGLKTQQVINKQKGEILNISQLNKLLFSEILDLDGFKLINKDGSYEEFDGAGFKKLKEDVRAVLIEKSRDRIFNDMGITVVGETLKFKNKDKLFDILKEEAETRGGYTENDIKQLMLKNGEIVIPIYMMASGQKFEGLINSVFSKITRLHNPGTSLVQVSGIGTKLKLSELTAEDQQEITWVQHEGKLLYDENKGLQYMRKDETDKSFVHGAQVIVSQYMDDGDGGILDMSTMMEVVNGKRILDTTKVPLKLLQLIGARIPNQGHSSMLPIQVVGFLPSYMPNAIIVPDGITSQMGSDFDVDKLYAYLSETEVQYNEQAKAEIEGYNAEITKLKDAYDKANTELFETHLPKAILNEIAESKKRKNKAVDKMSWLSDKERLKKQKTIDRENKLLESLYDRLESIDETTYKKVKIQQNKNKAALKEKIEKIKEDIKNTKKNAVSNINLIEYEYTKGADLNSLSESQLNNMYKDIHWSVLTHPEVFGKITRSLDLDDIKNEVDVLSFLTTKKNHWLPLSVGTQIDIYNDNKGGKKGVALFSLLSTWLANNVDKEVFAGHYDEKAEKTVHDPITIADEKGNPILLSVISSIGKYEHPTNKKVVRTKSDNVLMVQNESVDNAKNKLLAFFNWTPGVMTALSGYLSLSAQDGKIESIAFATRLFPQQIIKDYVKKYEGLRDPTNVQRTPNPDEKALEEIRAKYLGQMSATGREEKAKSKNREIFNIDRLLELLKIGHTDIKEYKYIASDTESSLGQKNAAIAKMDEYYAAQLDILDLYKQFENIGSEMTKVMAATSVDTKGLGKDVFTTLDKLRKLAYLNTSKTFINLDKIAGHVIVEDGTATGIANPIGETGAILQNSLFVVKKLYKDLYSLYFRDDTAKIVDQVFNTAGIDRNKIGTTKFVETQRKIFTSLKSYLLTNPDFKLMNDVEVERKRLLIDSDNNDSLAVRGLKIAKKFPKLQRNLFFSSLMFREAHYPGMASEVNYRNPFSDDLDEKNMTKGFLEMAMDDNLEIVEYARDLVLYSYVSGGVQNTSSFTRFIPIEFLQRDEDFMNAIANSGNADIDFDIFIEQLMKNIPSLAFQVTTEQVKKLRLNLKSSKMTIPDFVAKGPDDKDPYSELKVNLTSRDMDLLEKPSNQKKFPDYISHRIKDGFILFKRDKDPFSKTYTQVNLLGTSKSGVSEFAYGVNELQSVIDQNSLRPTRYRKTYLLSNDEFDKVVNEGHVITKPISFNAKQGEPVVLKNVNGDRKYGVVGYVGLTSDAQSIFIKFDFTRQNTKQLNMFFPGQYEKTVSGEKSQTTRVNNNDFTVGELVSIQQNDKGPVQLAVITYVTPTSYAEIANLPDSDPHFKLEGREGDKEAHLNNLLYLKERENIVKIGFEVIKDAGYNINDKTDQDNAVAFAQGLITPLDINTDDMPPEPTGNSQFISQSIEDKVMSDHSVYDFLDDLPTAPPIVPTAASEIKIDSENDDPEAPENAMDFSMIKTMSGQPADTSNSTGDLVFEQPFETGDITNDDPESADNAMDFNEIRSMMPGAAKPEAPKVETAKTVMTKYLPTPVTSISDALDKIDKNTKNPIYKETIKSIKSFTKRFPKTKIVVSTEFDVPGRIDNGTIYINPNLATTSDRALSKEENLENLLIHEIFHAYTLDVIEEHKANPKSGLLNQAERILLIKIQNLYQTALNTLIADPIHGPRLQEILDQYNDDSLTKLSPTEKSLYYGMVDVHEFVSMMMSDKDFQALMNTIKVTNDDTSTIWQQIKEAFVGLFKSMIRAFKQQHGITGDATESTVATNAISQIMGLVAARERNDWVEQKPDVENGEVELGKDDRKNSANFDPYKIATPTGLADANPDQVVAIDRLTEFLTSAPGDSLEDNVFLLNGPGGTGKTASLNNAVKNALRKSGNPNTKVAICAFTHTAKNELIKAGNKKAMTFHSMLGTEMIGEMVNGKWKESYVLKDVSKMKEDPEIFSADWIVIDEYSMIADRDMTLLRQRIKEAGTNPKILFMGDYAQLAPVGVNKDEDGAMVYLRKDPAKSVKLTQVMRTKAQDITDLANLFRLGIDFYNSEFDTKQILSKNTKMPNTHFLNGRKISTENVKFYNARPQFFAKFVEIFKSDPDNARNTAIISYNNESNKAYTNEVNAQIRELMFGKDNVGIAFQKGEPIMINNAVIKDKQVVYSDNERFIMKGYKKMTKQFQSFDKNGYSVSVILKVFDIKATDKNGEEASFMAMDPEYAAWFKTGRFINGLMVFADDTTMPYRDYVAVKNLKLPEINYAYVMNSYKVQGQTYEFPFVDERNFMNMANYTPPGETDSVLTPKMYAQNMYTAISRARKKVYIMTANPTDEKGTFVEPDFSDNRFKTKDSAATTDNLMLPNNFELGNQCSI